MLWHPGGELLAVGDEPPVCGDNVEAARHESPRILAVLVRFRVGSQ